MGYLTIVLLLLAAVVHLIDPQLPSDVGMRLPAASTADALLLANHLIRRPYGPKRVRRECRLLSEPQRRALFDAIVAAKRDTRMRPNVLDVFSSLHANPDVNTAAHGGPAFLSWHRVYIYLFEKLLRMYNPDVTLCYWDSTLEPVNMAQSAMWTPGMFGNVQGTVTTGFPGGWVTPVGVLNREGGARGRAMTTSDLYHIFSRGTLGEVSFPNGAIASNIEESHNYVHVYVGGLMGLIDTSSYDPIFWFHHTYIDCVYEWFREKQAMNGTVNRQLDWPLDVGDAMYGPLRSMRFGKLRNIDGANDWFSRNVVSCERMPERCVSDRQCGLLMRCNKMTGRCISDTIRSLTNPLMGGFGNFPRNVGNVGSLGNIRNMFGGMSMNSMLPFRGGGPLGPGGIPGGISRRGTMPAGFPAPGRIPLPRGGLRRGFPGAFGKK